jgi:D-xylose 1-dehydrogenase (NADP+, D-xylono-1,5-lactone-forming)
MHVDWTLRAIAAGKHVLCEKPLTRRPVEVEQVFDAAARAGVVVMEAFMYRFHPQTERLVGLVRERAVGRIAVIRGQFSYVARDLANVRLQRELDGGALMDLGCYCVSSARVVLDAEPERVFAEQVIGGDGVDVAMAATMRFPGDVLAHFDVGFEQVVRDELEIAGDEGALFLDDPWHCATPVIELRRDEGVERIEVDALNPYMCEVANMSAAVRGEAQPLLGRSDALAQARAIEALYSAATTGVAVGV